VARAFVGVGARGFEPLTSAASRMGSRLQSPWSEIARPKRLVNALLLIPYSLWRDIQSRGSVNFPSTRLPHANSSMSSGNPIPPGHLAHSESIS
jgi:hypothetical protein